MRASHGVRRQRATLAAATTTALVLAVGVVTLPAHADTAPAAPSTPVTVSADPLPTAQINGVAWNQQIVGNTVFVGGNFTSARPAGSPAGTNEVARTHLLSYNLTTGALLPWAPSLNGQVKDLAVSPDQQTLYVAGQFTTVNGQSRYRVASFDVATGALKSGFQPVVNSTVNAVSATGSVVVIGGSFSAVNNVSRPRAAALNPANGATLAFAPSIADGAVHALVIAPDNASVVVGGSFTSVSGSSNPGYGLARLALSTGASLPLPVNAAARNGTANSAILSLETDGTKFYGAGYVYGKAYGNVEGSFAADWATGNLAWIEDCHGDTYGVYPAGDAVYSASHKHYCGNNDGFPQTTPWTFYRGTATTKVATQVNTQDYLGYPDHRGRPSPTILTWYPDINAGTFTGKSQGPWTVHGNDQYVLFGGEFTRVENVAQQGLVRFAVSSIAPDRRGPSLNGAGFPLRGSSVGAGQVRLTWKANRDPDNETLTYRIHRGDEASPAIYQGTMTTPFWEPRPMTFLDTGAPPGTSQRYRLVATDAFGNAARSDWVTVAVSASGTPSSYAQVVQDDAPMAYWRLGELSGSTIGDASGFHPATNAGGITPATTGALAGDPDRAATFSGASTGTAYTTVVGNARDTVSVEAWIRTTTRRGGKIIGFGNASTGTSSLADRHLYMDNAGRLYFGMMSGPFHALATSGAYNDGAWHHVVGTFEGTTMRLYVDGMLRGSRSDILYTRDYWGLWRIGGDRLTGWPGDPDSDYLAGTLDEVAVYDHALSGTAVSRHYAAGTSGTPPSNTAPTASFTASTSGLTVQVDGSGSSDPDGSVVAWSWDFGDGTAGTGRTASHSYGTSGTYTVRLTVTDDRGGTGTTTRQVAVAGTVNGAPTASFTAAVSGLGVAVDGSGSSDPDGSIASYAWSFGDGSTATGRTASHTYGAAGTYTVALTVTDNLGATASTSRQVTVSQPPGPGGPFAQDSFGRTVTGGWGTADVGGAWSVALGSAAQASVDGQRGRHTLTPNATLSTVLGSVPSSGSEVRVVVSPDKVPNAGGAFVHVLARRVAADNSYGARLRLQPDGSVQLHVTRGNGSPVAGLVVPGLTYVAGDRLQVRVQVEGTSPTALRAKVWRLGSPEPATWQTTATDSTASLQVAGALGVSSYLFGTATNAPVVISFDDLWAGPVG